MEGQITKNRIIWINNLRAYACVLIVLIHVVSGWLDTSIIPLKQFSARWWFDCVFVQIITRVAVPIFVMITGALLLNPEKEITLKKIKKYILRMVGILFTFGVFYCICEELMAKRSYNFFQFICTIILKMFEEKTWTVMWYIYMIIGLYLITPLLRSFVKNEDKVSYRFILNSLFVLCLAIPTINYCFNTSITRLYLGGFTYIFYYLAGYYIFANCNKNNAKYFFRIGVIGLIGQVLLLIIKNYYYNYNLLNINYSCFNAMMSLSVFYYFKEYISIDNKYLNYISKYSFGIYLVHTVWLNLTYKLFNIYPDVLPVGLGETFFLLITLGLSMACCILLYKVPILKKILS